MAHKVTGRMGGMVSRHGPDKLTEELAVILSRGDAHEFKPLFDLVYENLRARKSANGGEEMLRLRVYEKLQSLVRCGMVKKTITEAGKHYKGLASLVAALPGIPGTAPLAI
jgi:hypothetical protein